MSAYPPWTAAGGDPLGRKRAFGEVEDPAAVEMGAEDGRGKRVSSGMGGGEQGLAELGQAGVGQQQQQQLYQHPPAYHQQSNAPPAPDSFGQTQPQLSTLASPSFPAPSLPHQSYPWHPQPLQRPTLPHASASFPAQYHPDSRSHSPASFAAAPTRFSSPSFARSTSAVLPHPVDLDFSARNIGCSVAPFNRRRVWRGDGIVDVAASRGGTGTRRDVWPAAAGVASATA
ncbi:hypothetical protein BJY59DRAFT_296601 [Rhodotorula toruloides]